MRLPRHADLIAETLKQLGIDQIEVFGMSWGGHWRKNSPCVTQAWCAG
jgi:pimeloyl-ACP methyl ester carboxylesterase